MSTSQNHAASIIAAIAERISQRHELMEDHVKILYTLVGERLFEAIHWAETGAVQVVTCPAGRRVYRVSEPSIDEGEMHAERTQTCYLEPLHCSCPGFLRNVVCLQTDTMCSHLLAIMISESLGCTAETHTMTDEAFAEAIYVWSSTK
ncbi:hypothetical protein BCR43DRAFT_488211 [Syncephalastrum racemosum]|uniref:SWIM-type domain-containing protein n=1 Tax=Syncephalastrum racemosum TaxID=13706 RepID=A0A1X2HIC3_SYNRA|nr:hypothetical protein BCR43DRAFT_488211 [Syncephalastrum racemosum]